MKEKGGQYWRDLFDARRATRSKALRGIFRFYELMAPVLEEEDIVYLGEGDTPIIEASAALQKHVGRRFAYKNDGMNPSASFKDRGMAGAYSYLKSLVRKNGWNEVLTICASTGDTSAAAAMYGAYVGDPIRTVVLLPHGKVTPAQLAQPLGSGLGQPIPGDDARRGCFGCLGSFSVFFLSSLFYSLLPGVKTGPLTQVLIILRQDQVPRVVSVSTWTLGAPLGSS